MSRTTSRLRSPKIPDYHLIDLATGESQGGFISLEAARDEARALGWASWQIWNGNCRVEYHDPDGPHRWWVDDHRDDQNRRDGSRSAPGAGAPKGDPLPGTTNVPPPPVGERKK